MRILVTMLSLFLFLSVSHGKETVYVVGAKGSADSGTLQSVTALVESTVSDMGSYGVIENRWKADHVLIPKLLKLGSSYILTVGKYQDKKLVTSKKMKSATLEDMDTVVSRVVRAVMEDVEITKTARVDEVTKDEVDRSKTRYQALRQKSIGIGAAWTSDLHYGGTGALLVAGYNFGVDPDYDLSVFGEFLFATGDIDVDYLNFSLAVSYYINRDKTAPYIRGGIGYGYASSEFDEVSSFSGVVGGGFKFFRTSTVHMGLDLSTTFFFNETEDTKEKPTITSLKLIVSY